MDLDRSVLFGGLHQPKVLVMGLGESGLAIARWCAQHGCALRFADSRQAPPNLAAALALAGGPHTVVERDAVSDSAFPIAALDEVDLVAISPGLSPLDAAVAPLLNAAKERGIPVWGELEFFSRALQALAVAGHASQVIAITGTNGKTTTTSLTGQLVARAGRTVAVAGNISPAMLDRLIEAIETEALPQVWVLELSSFQLETAQTFNPDVATVLNVTQDHLDWHGGFEAYAAAKFRIFGTTTKPVLNRDDGYCMAWQAQVRPEPVQESKKRGSAASEAVVELPPIVTFGVDSPVRPGDFGIERDGGLTWLAQAVNADGDDEDEAAAAAAQAAASGRRRARRGAAVQEGMVKPLMPVDALRIRGLHNAANALAALALCRGIGLSLAPLLHGLREYRGEPHRVELIASIDGIDYVDDSKATNVGATVAALDGLASQIVLIAGGDGKGQDFSPLTSVVSRWCKAVMLIGRDAPALRAALADCGVPLDDHPTLESATVAAAERAQPGQTVLLSPACASLDMFRNYAHRADVFRQSVAEIAAEQGITI